MKMKKILAINGPNLDLLGKRTLKRIRDDGLQNSSYDKEKGRKGKRENNGLSILRRGQNRKKIARSKADGLIFKEGGYSHYFVAIRDAIEANEKIRTAVLHVSDVDHREDFRRNDILKDVADVYSRQRKKGYLDAIEELKKII